MKELSIEEKAKAYDEAKARMSIAFNSNRCTIGFMNEIFPELKESEDERIRKALIKAIKMKAFPTSTCGGELFICGQSSDKCIDWLEKQGEQKPADKVEPKFKVGDWIIRNYPYSGTAVYMVVGVKRIDSEFYGYELDDGTYFSGSWESSYRLWTIQDAKDGDVLATENFIFIFKNIDNGNGVHYYCHYEISKHEDDSQFGVALPQSLMGRVGNSLSHYSPATKEQRDILFAGMKEAGYELDADRKELKKIVVPIFNIGDTIVEKDLDECGYGTIKDIKDGQYIFTDGSGMNINEQNGWQLVKTSTNIKQNPAWSEEDEWKFSDILALLRGGENCHYNTPDLFDWLKSIKDRKNWKPSDEQIETLESATENCAYSEYQDCLKELIAELKKLKG